MPTIRLSLYDKNRIIDRFRDFMERAKNSVPCPLEEDDFPEFGYLLLPEHTRKHYVALVDLDPTLLRQWSSWHTKVHVYGTHPKRGIKVGYEVRLETGDLPNDKLTLDDTHPRYAEIFEWCVKYNEIERDVIRADKVISDLVHSCTSTGQIARVLDEDLLRFLPSTFKDSLADAERRSRIPAHYERDDEGMAVLGRALALASICPKEYPEGKIGGHVSPL